MADERKRPNDLPPGTPSASVAMAFDNGAQVLRGTPTQVVDAATPLASQVDAETGTGNGNRMSALRVSQAIAAQVGSGKLAYSPLESYPDSTVGAKLQQSVSVLDFGAKGDAVPIFSGIVYQGCTGTDDTAAFAAAAARALAIGARLTIPPRRYKLDCGFVIPAAELAIEGFGAQVLGPGRYEGVDAFTWSGFRQGDDDTLQTRIGRQLQQLPSIMGFRTAIKIINSAWLNIEVDLVQQCLNLSETIAEADAGGYNIDRRFCVQNRIYVKTMAEDCVHGNVKIIDAMSNQGIQGCEYNVKYIGGSGNFIENYYHSTNPSSRAATEVVDFFNSYICPIVDGNGGTAPSKQVIVGNIVPTEAINYAYFEHEPINMASPLTSYSGIGKGQLIITAGRYHATDAEPYQLQNFLTRGPRTTCEPSVGTLFIHVNPAATAPGNGSVATPFTSFSDALQIMRDMDGFGDACVIQLAAGTYSDPISIDTRYNSLGNFNLIIRGVASTPASCQLVGGVTVQGAIGNITFEDVTIATNNLVATKQANVSLNRVNFGAMSGVQLDVSQGATVDILSNYTITGGAAAHKRALAGGRIFCLGQTVTVSGTPAFSSAFAIVSGGGSTLTETGTTYSGSATGIRYAIDKLGHVETNGGTVATFFPGSTAGALSSATYGVFT